MIFGRYEVRHNRCGGLLQKKTCGKCKREWDLISYLFNLSDFYKVNVGRENRKKKLKSRIQKGELVNRYPLMGPAGMYATMMGEVLPKWPGWVRVLMVFGLIFGLGYIGFRWMS